MYTPRWCWCTRTPWEDLGAFMLGEASICLPYSALPAPGSCWASPNTVQQLPTPTPLCERVAWLA